MSDNLLSKLYSTDVNHYELLELLQRHYHSATGTADLDQTYPAGDNYCLIVKTNDREISSISPGPGFSQDDFELLRNEVKAQLVENAGFAVRATILFSSAPVEGYFDGGNFRIHPIPPSAPRPNTTPALYPFVLEYQIRQSSDPRATEVRAQYRELELLHLLNVILVPRISSFSKFRRQMWVRDLKAANGIPTQNEVLWAEEYFTFEEFNRQPEIFSELSGPQLPCVDETTYYNNLPHPYHATLSVPSHIGTLLQAFHSLSPSDKIRWSRAANWMAIAGSVGAEHYANTFTSLIFAIESLMPEPPQRVQCKCCNRETGPGSTRLFQDFVEQHARGIPKDLLKEIWGIRSALAHGGKSLLLDDPSHQSFLAGTSSEFSKLVMVTTVSRLVLTNWLFFRASMNTSRQ